MGSAGLILGLSFGLQTTFCIIALIVALRTKATNRPDLEEKQEEVTRRLCR